MTKIKTCGLFRERDIDYVNQYLPDYAGFVLNFPKSRRSLSPEKAENLIRLLNPGKPSALWLTCRWKPPPGCWSGAWWTFSSSTATRTRTTSVH